MQPERACVWKRASKNSGATNTLYEMAMTWRQPVAEGPHQHFTFDEGGARNANFAAPQRTRPSCVPASSRPKVTRAQAFPGLPLRRYHHYVEPYASRRSRRVCFRCASPPPAHTSARATPAPPTEPRRRRKGGRPMQRRVRCCSPSGWQSPSCVVWLQGGMPDRRKCGMIIRARALRARLRRAATIRVAPHTSLLL